MLKKMVQYYLDMNKIEEFKSLNEAQVKLNIDRRQIGYVANGKKENVSGFIFKYV